MINKEFRLRSSRIHIVSAKKSGLGEAKRNRSATVSRPIDKIGQKQHVESCFEQIFDIACNQVRGSVAVMRKNGSYLGWLAAGLAVSGLAMTPALARVLSDDSNRVSLDSLGSIGSFTVAGADPELVAKYRLNALRGTNKFKFTPVSGNRDKDRAVTVVVRQQGSKAVTVRESIALANVGSKQLASTKITPTSYSLGSAKGLKSFAIPVKNLGGNLPDLGEIGVGQAKSEDKPTGKKSRFKTRFSLDAKSPIAAPARALSASEKDYTLDVGGSYSVTKNIAVTAGVRYNNERDRMAPLTDSRQDSQAVYVGTQFRF